MKNIGSIQSVNEILKKEGLYAKKKFGQNFLVDQNILNSIVDASGITKDINVIEIGPGLGALTEHLCEKANKVLCYEIDTDMIRILKENLEYDNYEVLHKNILEADINKDIENYFDEKPIYLVANLPYYITTPIILGLLEKTTKIKKYTMMMQYEVAMRICSKPDVKDYNALSIVIQYRAQAKKALDVPRTVFIPAPNVDSAVVVLDLYDKPLVQVDDEEFFFKIVRGAFAQRRKTLVNNLSLLGYDKVILTQILTTLNINPQIRSEALDVETLAVISNKLLKIKV